MKQRRELTTTAAYALIAALTLVLAINQYMIQSINSGINDNIITGKSVAAAQSDADDLEKAVETVIPRGTPVVYGSELNVSFDRPTESLDMLAALDGDLYSDGKLKYADLSDEQKKRYLRVGASIACEYCCGAKTLVFSDGQPACGCQHSAAMRGLAKYLLTNHENEYSDQEILGELTKWKALFFPKQTIAKYLQAGGSSITSLPDMVGGC